MLRKNKLEVRSEILKKKTRNLYHGYLLNRLENRPKIILKLAVTLDDYITLKKGTRTKITNSITDTYSDILRSEVDAILVGSNTVKIDNCILKCKMPSLIKKSPIRVVLNKKLDLNTNAKIFNNCKKFRTIIFTNNSSKKLMSKFKKKNVEVICLTKKKLQSAKYFEKIG